MFLHHLVEFNGVPWMALNHHWHGVNVLSVLECCLLAGLLCSVLTLLLRRSRRLRIAAVIGSLFFATAAYAANTALSALSASGALAGANLIYVVQTVGSGGVKATMTQVATFINSLFSGDFTVTSGGVATLKNTGPGATGPLGSATVAPIVTIDAQGRVTALSSATVTPAMSSVTGRAALSQLPQGIANSIWINPTGSTADMQNVAVPACANDGVHALVYINATGLQCASLTTGGAGTVTTITPGAGLVSGVTASCTQTNITVTGTLSAAECLNAQVGTSYAIADSDRGKLVTGTNSSAQAYSIAQAGTASAFANGWFTRVQNKGTGVLVITPTTSTINGAASLSVFPGQTVKITSDGANYQASTESPTAVAATDQTGANYAFKSSDYGGVVYLSNASPQVPTIAQAGTTGFPAGWYVTACNIGAGTQTITPTTSTIGGASTKVLRAAGATAPACSTIISDGSNYRLVDDAQAAIGTSGATLPLLNGSNTWSGVQTFGQTIGAVSTQSGTTYTLANTDCGSTVRFTNASAVTVTIPQGLTVGCVIAIEQAAAGAVSVNGSAVTPATLHSAHSYTKTSAQWAVIGIFTESSNVAILTGDGA